MSKKATAKDAEKNERVVVLSDKLAQVATTYGLPVDGWPKMSAFFKALEAAKAAKAKEAVKDLVAQGLTYADIMTSRPDLSDLKGEIEKLVKKAAYHKEKWQAAVKEVRAAREEMSVLKADRKAVRQVALSVSALRKQMGL